LIESQQREHGACPAGEPRVVSFSGDQVQFGRVFRNLVSSSCGGKAYPGLFDSDQQFLFETFHYPNTANASACVTVNFNPDAGSNPCGVNAHASAYLDAYDPGDQAANYLGDVGSSIAQPFSFALPAGSEMVLVVANTAEVEQCSFAYQIVDLPCEEAQDPTPLPAVPVPASGRLALFALMVLLALIGMAGIGLRRA
jgi:hypothetical protein